MDDGQIRPIVISKVWHVYPPFPYLRSPWVTHFTPFLTTGSDRPLWKAQPQGDRHPRARKEECRYGALLRVGLESLGR